MSAELESSLTERLRALRVDPADAGFGARLRERLSAESARERSAVPRLFPRRKRGLGFLAIAALCISGAAAAVARSGAWREWRGESAVSPPRAVPAPVETPRVAVVPPQRPVPRAIDAVPVAPPEAPPRSRQTLEFPRHPPTPSLRANLGARSVEPLRARERRDEPLEVPRLAVADERTPNDVRPEVAQREPLAVPKLAVEALEDRERRVAERDARARPRSQEREAHPERERIREELRERRTERRRERREPGRERVGREADQRERNVERPRLPHRGQ